jgi:Polyketide cyclase / dehydrase and lipid transport
VDVTADLAAPCAPAALLSWVADLGRYPEWLSIVTRATPADALPGDRGPAWLVDLRGRLGPLARSKRLRMVRTLLDDDRAVFERSEADSRSHAPWVLEARVAPTEDGSHLVMHLHYGGALWGPVLERMLGDEIEKSRPRLLACLSR